MKKLLKWVGVIVGIYVAFVVIFETVYLGYYQPSFEEGGIPMLDIVTKDDAGNLKKRRLARFKSSEGHLYVSVATVRKLATPAAPRSAASTIQSHTLTTICSFANSALWNLLTKHWS